MTADAEAEAGTRFTSSVRSHLLALRIPSFFSSFRSRRRQLISALDHGYWAEEACSVTMVVVVAPSVEEERAVGVVLIREYEAERDRDAVENLERMCDVGPSGGGGGGMSLFTDLLGDPLCRVRHSPSFLMLVAEIAIGQENRAIVGIIRGCVKIVTCGTQKPRLAAGDPAGASPVPIYAKVAYLLGLRVSPFHRHSTGFVLCVGPAAMALSPSREEVLSLFRSLLRTTSNFSDYNIREDVKRRTVDGFRDHRGLSDPSSVAAAFADGNSQLEVAKRKVIVYSLYATKVKSVMEARTL